jgi:hypothetical protein
LYLPQVHVHGKAVITRLPEADAWRLYRKTSRELAPIVVDAFAARMI